MYDAIIAGGKVIDGSGSPAFDAEGRVVAPCFIAGLRVRQSARSLQPDHPGRK
jgi:hypothetical protein